MYNMYFFSTSGADCDGFRTWGEREFHHFGGKPPVLVFEPKFYTMGEKGRHEEKVTKFTESIIIAEARYKKYIDKYQYIKPRLSKLIQNSIF